MLAGPVSSRLISAKFHSTLPHGGVLVHFPRAGHTVQFGVPPGSIKDIMKLSPLWRPDLRIVDKSSLFDSRTGRMADPEFPMYHSFFIESGCKKAAAYAAPADVLPHLDTILRVSYLGPQESSFSRSTLADEYPHGEMTPGYPDMPAELQHWAAFPLCQLRQLHPISEGGLNWHGALICQLGDCKYRLFDRGDYLGDLDMTGRYFESSEHIPGDVTLTPAARKSLGKALRGDAMVVPIHTSDGFDPNGETSGHMLWNGGYAILVDPPVDTLSFLRRHDISLNRVLGVILTHVHSDHDGGTLPILLAHGRKNLWTTFSIESMYVSKLTAAMAGRISAEKIRSWWNFQPLVMKTPTVINGLRMIFRHGFHSNVAIGFSIMSEGGPMLDFSGDTRNDVSVLELISSGVISGPERAADIVAAPLTAALKGGVSVHEAGGGLLHTQPQRLRAAMEMVAKSGKDGKILAYHAPLSRISKEGLEAWQEGFAGSIALPVSGNNKTDLVSRLAAEPVFAGLPTDALRELSSLATTVQVKAGRRLATKGAHGRTFYLLLRGRVDVQQVDKDIPAVTLTSGLIGEAALLGERRNASVITQGQAEILRWETNIATIETFARYGVVERLRHLRAQRAAAFPRLRNSALLQGLDHSVFDSLLMAGKLERFAGGNVMICQGEHDTDVFLLLHGVLEVVAANGDQVTSLATLSPGDIVGEISALYRTPRSATVRVGKKGAALLRVPGASVGRILHRTPGLAIRLHELAVARRLVSAGTGEEKANLFSG